MAKPPSQVSILMYHSISRGSSPTCISPQEFRDQLAVLSDQGYRAISMSELAAWHRGDVQLNGPSVVLTFDDGFEDFASVVVPELEKRKLDRHGLSSSRKNGGPRRLG